MERLQEPTRVLEPRLDLTLWSVARASAEKLVTLPLDCAFYVLSGVESVLSEILLSAGRPTPSQCAVRLLPAPARPAHSRPHLVELAACPKPRLLAPI